jgi:hypothetical protein
MNETEQDLLRKVLVDLFLATPRKRTQLHRQEHTEETQRKASTARRTRKQHRGGKTHDQ